MSESLAELKAREEAKRERNWDPAMRWKVLQATIAWAADQDGIRRNTPAACKAKEQKLLAGLAADQARCASATGSDSQ
jgi:hypothetical protein